MSENKNRAWRRFKDKVNHGKSMGPDDLVKPEKKWKLVYFRKNKLARARQLGFDYPVSLKAIAQLLSSLLIPIVLNGCFWEQARKDYLLLNDKLPHSYMSTSTGRLLPKGNKKAVYSSKGAQKLFEQTALSANSGSPRDMGRLGHFYLVGLGTEPDLGLGIEWTEKAALAGHASSQHNLAWLHENGTGVEQSWQKARTFYELASEQNYAQSMHNLGRIYANGHGVEKDLSRSFEYYKLAAGQSLSIAQYTVATFYETGQVVYKDLVAAKKYYGLACEQRFEVACESLERLCKLESLC